MIGLITLVVSTRNQAAPEPPWKLADAHFLARLPDRVIRVEEVLAVEAPRGKPACRSAKTSSSGCVAASWPSCWMTGLYTPYWSSSISSRLTETVFLPGLVLDRVVRLLQVLIGPFTQPLAELGDGAQPGVLLRAGGAGHHHAPAGSTSEPRWSDPTGRPRCRPVEDRQVGVIDDHVRNLRIRGSGGRSGEVDPDAVGVHVEHLAGHAAGVVPEVLPPSGPSTM